MLRRYVLEGSHREMGRAFGREAGDAITKLFSFRRDNALAQAEQYGGRPWTEEQMLRLAGQCLPIVSRFHPEGYEELLGIAEGAEFPIESIWAMNALTDLRDLMAFGAAPDAEGCSSFVVQSADDYGWLCGQTWDLATDNMPFVCLVERHPAAAPASLSFTTVGCLSLIGMNQAGVAVGTTNLRTVDARPGVGYLDMIHAALHAATIEGACDRIANAPRMGAHYFYVVASDGARTLECSAAACRTNIPDAAPYAHCNHFLCGETGRDEANTPMASSKARQARLTSLLAEGPLTVAGLKAALSDHDGGDEAICRHGANGISSNGSVIMAPARREAWVVHGPACSGTWAHIRLD